MIKIIKPLIYPNTGCNSIRLQGVIYMNFIKEPLTIGMDPASEERIIIHKNILAKKLMIKDVFNEFHKTMIELAQKHFKISNDEIELGAGVYPLKNSKTGILATDIVPASHLDRVLDAQNLDIEDEKVSVIYGQNCFHHFPQPELFFKEALRVLSNEGGIILIEPHHGFFANFLYKKLFTSEGYDKNSIDWHFLNRDLPNQALSYICFVRDNKKFNELFPNLEVVEVRPATNWLRYLLSGGLNFKQLVPNSAIPLLRFFEFMLKPFSKQLALHCYFVIRKRK